MVSATVIQWMPLLFSGWAGPIIMVVDIVKDSGHIVSFLLPIENFGHHVGVVVTSLAMCGQQLSAGNSLTDGMIAY